MTLIYRHISKFDDQVQIQSDLNNLEKWREVRGMQCTAKKCYIMTIGKSTNLVYLYQLDSSILECGLLHYLGVKISAILNSGDNVNTITKKANSRLGFFRRNLRGCLRRLKKTALLPRIFP